MSLICPATQGQLSRRFAPGRDGQIQGRMPCLQSPVPEMLEAKVQRGLACLMPCAFSKYSATLISRPSAWFMNMALSAPASVSPFALWPLTRLPVLVSISSLTCWQRYQGGRDKFSSASFNLTTKMHNELMTRLKACLQLSRQQELNT